MVVFLQSARSRKRTSAAMCNKDRNSESARVGLRRVRGLVGRYLMNEGWIVVNRGWFEMLESFNELTGYRPSLSTLRFEGGDLDWRLLHWGRRPCTRRHALKASLLAFVKMTRVLRRAGVIDGRRLTIRLRSEKDECRLYIQRSPAQFVPGLYLLGKR